LVAYTGGVVYNFRNFRSMIEVMEFAKCFLKLLS
jgi:hypothetical protein